MTRTDKDKEAFCKHEMPESWCADCSDRRGIEAELEQEEKDLDDMVARWERNSNVSSS